MARFGEINAQYFDDAGDPLGSGKLYFYESGTTTLKTTYSDINQTVANTNPVILTAAGRQPNIFFNGVAKAILTDSSDVQILVRDPVGQTASAFGDAWVATKIYDADAVVLASNGVYYRSLVAANQNNDPTSTSGYWTLLYSIEWNSGITYSEGANVTQNEILYQSLQNNNTNQNPSSSPAYWTRIGIAWVSTVTYAINENVVGSDGVFYTSLQNSNLNNEPSVSGSYWVGTSAAAAASATAAATSATNAATSETNAGNSATAAATSETNAATSATNAGNSATAAATSETNAATSETNASNSASAAATSATNAATSETNAGNSATAAAASATAASTSESNAAASATTASTAATNAGTSETNAATSATNASNSATAAATSATNAATSETNAATSATNAATSATASATSATASAGSATNAASSLADFNTKYLGAHATAPTGTAAGQQYFNTTSNLMFVYTGSAWTESGSSVNGTSNRVVVTATAAQTDFSITYDVGYVDVYLNGSKLQAGTDFTATNGVTVVLTSGAAAGDIVDMVAYGAFNVANVYTQTESDARFAQLSNNLSDLASASTALTNLGVSATAAELNYSSGVTSAIQTQLNAKGTVSNLADLGITSTSTEINLLDALSRGSLLYGNASAATAILTKGTANQVLTSDGTDIAWADPAGGGAVDYQSFTSSGTWTKAADVNYVLVEVIAGGGGGCQTIGTSSQRAQGGGGGQGARILFRASDLGSTETVTIGAGGAGAAGWDGGDGGDGGNSSFGSHLVCAGGLGGGVSSSGSITSGSPLTKGRSGSGATSMVLDDSNADSSRRFGVSNYAGGGGGMGQNMGGGNAVIGGGGGGGSYATASAGAGGTSLAGGNGGAGVSGGAGGLGGGGGGTGTYATASGAGGAGTVKVWSW